MKKVILYHPATHHERFYSFYWIPYSLLTIASVIADNYDVVIIDDNLEDNDINYKELTDNCLCVGITAMTGHQITGGLQFAEKIRCHNPDIPIIWGGTHATILTDETIQSPLVDIVVRGQGELPFKELIKRIDLKQSLSGVKGVSYKEKGTIIHNEKNPLYDKSAFPVLPWHLIDIRRYLRNDPKIGSKILNYISSQGCPFGCTFCSEVALYDRKWKTYGVERIMSDIRYLIEFGGANAIKFYDANLFVNLDVVFKMADICINEKFDITWAASGHPKTLMNLTKEKWALLSKSKCVRLLIGAESGSQNALNLIKKGITPQIIENLARKCSDYGIVGSFTFIVGFPNCSDDLEIEKTIKLASKVREIDRNHDVKIHFYAPYPGTPLYTEACKAGFKTPEGLQSWSNYDYYCVGTPWIKKEYEKIIHSFNSDNSPYVHL
ncbi:hypothetical protein FACS189411_10880 [Bacteroidia bacterium]|nr:hypothetical protein FACS189411_10880 [Bacteroidia bacterium]